MRLDERLESYISQERPIGLFEQADRRRFLEELKRSLTILRAVRTGQFGGSTDPRDAGFHPYRAIRELTKAGDNEEAIWLSFLVTMCGASEGPAPWQAVRYIYGASGDTTRWTWNRIRDKAERFRGWMTERREEVCRLPFGNHRKYETHDPLKSGSTPDIVDSYVEWVEREGQGSQVFIFQEGTCDRTVEAAFDVLYRMITVKRFGRTARFDWLCLLGNLGIWPLAPSRCYLRGASGPLKGAKRLFGFTAGQSLEVLEGKAMALANALGVPIEAIEDTLCNWQKSGKAIGGWLSSGSLPCR